VPAVRVAEPGNRIGVGLLLVRVIGRRGVRVLGLVEFRVVLVVWGWGARPPGERKQGELQGGGGEERVRGKERAAGECGGVPQLARDAVGDTVLQEESDELAVVAGGGAGVGGGGGGEADGGGGKRATGGRAGVVEVGDALLPRRLRARALSDRVAGGRGGAADGEWVGAVSGPIRVLAWIGAWRRGGANHEEEYAQNDGVCDMGQKHYPTCRDSGS
jgi:hypothetical protein